MSNKGDSGGFGYEGPMFLETKEKKSMRSSPVSGDGSPLEDT